MIRKIYLNSIGKQDVFVVNTVKSFGFIDAGLVTESVDSINDLLVYAKETKPLVVVFHFFYQSKIKKRIKNSQNSTFLRAMVVAAPGETAIPSWNGNGCCLPLIITTFTPASCVNSRMYCSCSMNKSSVSPMEEIDCLHARCWRGSCLDYNGN